ncbi:TPA: glycerophosphodiester phosphodiesterase family protein [Streptococcus suis]
MKTHRSFGYYAYVFWSYLKYQIMTKTFILFILLPFYQYILDWLLALNGRVAMSSGDFYGFIFSKWGFVAAFISLGLMAILIALDIDAFVILTYAVQVGQEDLHTHQLIKLALKSVKRLFRPSGLILIAYFTLLVPLLGIGLTVSPFSNFTLPNFISQVIFDNPLYMIIYFILMIIFTSLSLIYLFFFHFYILEGYSLNRSLRASRRLVFRHWRDLIRDLVWWGIKVSGLAALGAGILLLLLFALLSLLGQSGFLFSLFTQVTFEILALGSIMILPVFFHRLTTLYIHYQVKSGQDTGKALNFASPSQILTRSGPINPFNKILIGGLVSIFALANIGLAYFLEQASPNLFIRQDPVEIVAHRAGGDLASENSILGMEKALETGAKWAEIDVQRTKDGYYIINHDSTFKRTAGLNQSAGSLTLEQIQALSIRDLFNPSRPSQPVASIDQFLQAAKDRIGLFIELKGSSADRQMVDDMVKLVKDYQMQDQVVLLSLDYSLITYLEAAYPEMTSGYLYFFIVGRMTDLVADYLLMEEKLADDATVLALHAAGKKVYVWTVNDQNNIDHFVASNVDGIITDRVKSVQTAIIDYHEQDHLNQILIEILP